LVIFGDSRAPLTAVVQDYDGTPAPGASIALDYDALLASARELRLRERAPGDRMCVSGMSGSKKLQDIFVDAKIPRGERDALAVIATEDDVLWIPGLRRSRLYEPTERTRRVVILTPAESIGG
jgi:tRNA(Ile)-lysidine synthetase-like protein